MNCDVISYFGGKSPRTLADVSRRYCLFFAGESPGNLIDVSCWVTAVVRFVEVDTRLVSLSVWCCNLFLIICALRCVTRSLAWRCSAGVCGQHLGVSSWEGAVCMQYYKPFGWLILWERRGRMWRVIAVCCRFWSGGRVFFYSIFCKDFSSVHCSWCTEPGRVFACIIIPSVRCTKPRRVFVFIVKPSIRAYWLAISSIRDTSRM